MNDIALNTAELNGPAIPYGTVLAAPAGPAVLTFAAGTPVVTVTRLVVEVLPAGPAALAFAAGSPTVTVSLLSLTVTPAGPAVLTFAAGTPAVWLTPLPAAPAV